MRFITARRLLRLLVCGIIINNDGRARSLYCHNYYGPILYKHEVLIAYLQEIEVIDLRPYDGPFEVDCIISLNKFDDAMFSQEELDVLKDG